MFQPFRHVKDQNREDPRLEHLISSLGQGDIARLEEFYQLTSAAVFGLALSIVQNFHDAEDITHETYVRVFQSAGTYEARGKPLAWVFTIAKNLALMKIRDRKKTDLFPNDSDMDSAADAMDYANEDRIVLQAFLRELSAEEQGIVVLHAVSGWKHREIAAFLKLPVQHIIVKYNRAIKKLVRKYKQQGLHKP